MVLVISEISFQPQLTTQSYKYTTWKIWDAIEFQQNEHSGILQNVFCFASIWVLSERDNEREDDIKRENEFKFNKLNTCVVCWKLFVDRITNKLTSWKQHLRWWLCHFDETKIKVRHCVSLTHSYRHLSNGNEFLGKLQHCIENSPTSIVKLSIRVIFTYRSSNKYERKLADGVFPSFFQFAPI